MGFMSRQFGSFSSFCSRFLMSPIIRRYPLFLIVDYHKNSKPFFHYQSFYHPHLYKSVVTYQYLFLSIVTYCYKLVLCRGNKVPFLSFLSHFLSLPIITIITHHFSSLPILKILRLLSLLNPHISLLIVSYHYMCSSRISKRTQTKTSLKSN